MFKLTMFSPIHPNKVGPALKGLHFKETKKGFEWNFDGHTFLICPFGTQGDYQESYGYRVFFDGLIDGGLYLFEMSMSCFNPSISAVEFDLFVTNLTQKDWIRDLNRRPSFKSLDLRGIYRKDQANIVCLPNDTVNIQIRKKTKAIKLPELLKEVDSIRDELTPSKYDLFSVNENMVV